MPVRDGMTDLVAEVRRMVGDPAGSATFSDDEIQEALDQNRVFHRYLALDAELDYATNRYPAFVSLPHWEDPELFDYRYQAVVLGEADESGAMTGRWVFDVGRVEPTLYVSGYAYDLGAAAVTVIDWWLAKLKNSYDVSVGGDSFSRSQKITNLLGLKTAIEAKSVALTTTKNYRSDWGRRRDRSRI